MAENNSVLLGVMLQKLFVRIIYVNSLRLHKHVISSSNVLNQRDLLWA